MHWNVDNSAQYCEDLIYRIRSLFELQIFVPEWMRQEIEANAIRTSFEKSAFHMSVHGSDMRVRQERGRRADVALNVRVMVLNRPNGFHDHLPQMDSNVGRRLTKQRKRLNFNCEKQSKEVWVLE